LQRVSAIRCMFIKIPTYCLFVRFITYDVSSYYSMNLYIYICNNSICNSHIVVLIVVVIGSISYTEWNVMPCTRICRMNAWPAAWCAWWPLGRWSGGQWLHGYHSPNKNPNGWMIYNGRNGWFGGTSQFRKPPICLLLLFCFVLSRILSTFGMIWRDFSNVRLVEYTRMVDEYGEVGHKNGMITTCWDNDILTISIRTMILYNIIYS